MKGDFQVNNTYTVDFQDSPSETQLPSTGTWNESYKGRPENIYSLQRIVKIAGFSIFLAFSSLTTMPDPWLIEKRRRDSVVTMPIVLEVLGRAISRSEALRIARQILEQAEQERRMFADFEANRGIQWRDGV